LNACKASLKALIARQEGDDTTGKKNV